MPAATHILTLPGPMLERGFWLYVWVIDTGAHRTVYYVGRTGDTSTPHANPPFVRMGQHLSGNVRQNQLRKNLEKAGISPEDCHTFQMIAHGPLFPPQQDMESHTPYRDIVSALEKKLADSMTESGYEVINKVRSRMTLDQRLWVEVKAAFAPHFPMLVN